MIVAMKKVSLLCLAKDSDRTLGKLREMGVLHLEPFSAPGSVDYESLQAERERTKTALSVLRAYTDADAAAQSGSEVTQDGQKVVDETISVLSRRQELQERRSTWEQERVLIEPLGTFSPDQIGSLRDSGVTVKLYHLPAKSDLTPPEGGRLFTLQQDTSGRYVAIVSTVPFEVDVPEYPLPARSLSKVVADIATADSELTEIEEELKSLSASIGSVSTRLSQIELQSEYREALEGMGQAEQIAYLRGYCPADLTDNLQAEAGKHGWGLVIGDPSEGDAVPTLIRYPSWVRVIQPVFKFLGIVPGYKETDISPAFFVFLSIFFAMIVGDAGYGLLFLILIPYFRKTKFSAAPAEPFNLLYIFSACTVVWGILTGSYFGIDFTLLPAALQAIRVDWLVDQNNSMTFSLLLGAIHLTLAHSWKALRFGWDARALVQLGWIGVVWGIFVVARMLLLGSAFPGWFVPVPVAGLVAILAGMIIRKLWMDLGLLVLDLVSCFGDLMSYLRLFALGIASVKVADAFNGMAGDLGVIMLAGAEGVPAVVVMGVLAAVAMALVLAVGHGLNIILCAMSVLVHGVRLNALEFSMHLGQEWSGFEYQPFAAHASTEGEAVPIGT